MNVGVTVELLDTERAAKLRASRLTYAEVGRTAGDPPPGYRSFTRGVALPEGVGFAEATRDLLHWEVQQRAGLRVAASGDRVVPDAVVVLGLGIGPLRLRAPCRVVYVVDEARRQGFAYGTLPGHPESGEEAFLLEQLDDGTVRFTITVFSRPANVWVRLGEPIGRRVQDAVTARYFRALTGPRMRINQ